jgi:oxygen-independent coproporphyrinogen-3 oxidase
LKQSKQNEIIEKANRCLKDFSNLQKVGMLPKDGAFFPAGVHYPPITDYQDIDEDTMFETYTLPEDKMFDVYVHIPFCRKRCVFCHYPSLYGAVDEEKDRYLDALEKEMDIVMRRLGVDKIKVRSILVGGGTPTDLTPKQLDRFLAYFCSRLDLSRIQQFNYDVDPITLVNHDGIERLKIMRDYRVDRQTIGVQSFNDKILKRMNRSHDQKVALESIKNCLDMGYQVNIEFIFGYPGQTLQNWIEVMETALNTGVHEMQFYRLKPEPYGDQTGTITKINKLRPELIPSAEESLLMKQISIDMMAEKGFHENLRRVFTTHKKYISKYAFNQCCNLLDEIGFGLTAFSSLRDRFILNVQSFEKYYRAIEEERMPMNRGIVRNPEEQIRWATILPLKNFFLRKNLFKERTGRDIDNIFTEKFSRLQQYGLLNIGEKRIELTELGAFFADEVVMQFYGERYLPLPSDSYENGPLNPLTNPAFVEQENLTAYPAEDNTMCAHPGS